MHDSLYAELAHLESRLVDTGRLCSRAENVHLVWQIVGYDDAHDFLEEAVVC